MVKDISDSRSTHKYLSGIQALDRRNSGFNKWVGEMERYIMFVDSSEGQNAEVDSKKQTMVAIERYGQMLISNIQKMTWEALKAEYFMRQ